MEGETDPMELKFSEDVRSRVSERDRSMMTICEQSTASLLSAVEAMTEHFLIPAPGDVRDVHNNYVRAILASTSAKLVSLTVTLIEAANKYDFLGYALAARSIVEIIATLRYLLRQRLQPIIQKMTGGQYTADQVIALVKEEDIYLRGTRFDWVAFFEEGFRPLNERYSEWLKEKKRDKTAKKWKPGRTTPIVEQVSVTTCLEKWASDQPGIGVLYDLLCDMVHPNIGSVMSTMVPNGDKIRFRVRDPSSEGFALFRSSLPAFLSLTHHERADLFQFLLALFLPTKDETT
jgi:hypothetical protein